MLFYQIRLRQLLTSWGQSDFMWSISYLCFAEISSCFGFVFFTGSANRLFLFLFLICFWSKCCRESSRYNFFPSETFLGGKWICIETFLGDKHFFSENFLDNKILSLRTYLIAKFYHWVFSRCQEGNYCLWERSRCIVPCHRERSRGIVTCHRERSRWGVLFTLHPENTQW